MLMEVYIECCYILHRIHILAKTQIKSHKTIRFGKIKHQKLKNYKQNHKTLRKQGIAVPVRFDGITKHFGFEFESAIGVSFFPSAFISTSNWQLFSFEFVVKKSVFGHWLNIECDDDKGIAFAWFIYDLCLVVGWLVASRNNFIPFHSFIGFGILL